MRILVISSLFLLACGGTSPAALTPVSQAQEKPSTQPKQLNCAATLLNDNHSVVVTTPQFRNDPKGRKFSAQSTTASTPLETCGVNRQLRVLTRLRCDDGSNPFTDLNHAHRARLANVGASGRCKGIVDQYRVPCPEKNYDLYMDSYVCEIDELSDDASPFSMLKIGSADLPVPINWSLIDNSLAPFVATLISKPNTEMTAISIVAIVTEAEAQKLLQAKLSAYSVPLKLKLPRQGELLRTGYGDSLNVSLLWQASATNSDKGRLFMSFGGADSPHLKQLDTIAPDMLGALTPNEHVVDDFFELLDGDTEVAIRFQDDAKQPSTDSDESLTIDAQKINGHLAFVPLHWEVNSWKNGFTALKTVKTEQLRYIYALSDGVHPDIQQLLRNHMSAISSGTLIAYQATEGRGIHTVHEHNGNRLFMSSFDTPLGHIQCMLIGPQEELRKPEYGQLFSALVKTSWASASVEAEGGLDEEETK